MMIWSAFFSMNFIGPNIFIVKSVDYGLIDEKSLGV